MKDKFDQIIYVGKAKNLRNRVQSYFNHSAKNTKTEILVGRIKDFEFIITENDAESFVLENNLIKKYTPKYNIRLKDDKSYPYLVVKHHEPFPRLEYIRKVKKEKLVEVFGPFVTGSNISEIITVLTKHFKLRDCSLSEFKKRKEPCLLFQMSQCSAPCVNKISESDYELNLKTALDIFKFKGIKTIKSFEDKMEEAANKEEFELAAQIRDSLKMLIDFKNKSMQENAELEGAKNIDVIASYQGDDEVDISIYMIRNGLLLGHKNFHFSNFDIEENLEDSLINFLLQYYSSTHDTKPDIIVSKLESVFSLALSKLLIDIKLEPPIGKYLNLWQLTSEHAFESQRVRLKHEDSVYIGLNKLKDLLSLKERPVVLECFDIAIFQGKSPTASQIVFHEGVPDRKNYRHYNLTELPEGNNDFKMMEELITRRIDNGNLPDVFVVDGGMGQVNILKAVLKEFKIDIPVIGIAKSKVKKKNNSFKEEIVYKSEERLLIAGRSNPFILNQNRALFKIIVGMRDEAHRFARRLHHKKEKERVIKKSKN